MSAPQAWVPPRESFPTDLTVLIQAGEMIDLLDLGYPHRPKTDDLGRCQFTAFWPTDQGWVPGGVRAQVFHTNLEDWRERHERQGLTLVYMHPCSYPGCGKPTACLMHRDGMGQGWRHVDPADEVDSHVGYPMQHATPGQVST